MNSEETELAESRLRTLRDELSREKEQSAESTAPVELDQARVGRLSRMDDMQQQAMAKELSRRRDTQLKRIEGALQRLEKGTYGSCSKCGKVIDGERLDLDPTAFFCIGCAATAEKR